MRRSASEIIRSLESRIARLENRSSSLNLDGVLDGTSSMSKVELSDLAVNKMRDSMDNYQERKIQSMVEEAQDQGQADLKTAMDWSARKVSGQVASKKGLKDFMHMRGWPVELGREARYWMYFALIAKGVIKQP